MHCDCTVLKVLEHIHINYFKILVYKGYLRIDFCWLLFVLIRSLRNIPGCTITHIVALLLPGSCFCSVLCLQDAYLSEYFWSSLFICYLSYCGLTWGNGLKHEFSASSLWEISVFCKANALESLALFLIADNLLTIL